MNRTFIIVGNVLAATAILGCAATPPTNAPLPAEENATVDQQKTEVYIRENINDLSPEEPVLGGVFYVTSIRWEQDDTAIVDYEDGHIALRARAEISMDTDGKISVTAFVVIEENPPPPSFERDRAGLDEMCGGIAGILCEEGLICDYEGDYPDASGTCVEDSDPSALIKQEFEGKVVYGTGEASEEEITRMREDCNARNGAFDECGSPCAPNADFCMEVCAYTCTFGEATSPGAVE